VNVRRTPACAAALAVAIVAAAVVAAAAGAPPARGPILQAHGVGTVRFGMRKGEAVPRLRVLFGAPSARGVNTGCGARYTEVEWGDFVAEFRLGTFSGYRFVRGGYPLTTARSPREASPPAGVSPALATAGGITLGSTIADLRSLYRLRRAGANLWRASNGLLFVDDAKRDPVPPASQIVEIKIGTCGDF
jgi:hypothetical protein